MESLAFPPDFRVTADALAHRLILITGAASGLGYAVAQCCAQAGAQIIAFDRQQRGLEQLADAIATTAAHAPLPVIQTIDFRGATPKDYGDLAQRLAAQFGRLDGLIHCAAVANTLTPIEHCSVEDWYVAQQVNLNAPFLLTQSLLPLLAKSSAGSVIFATDTAATREAYWGSYGVAKAGLQSLAAILADEWETRGLRVNCLDSGPMRTNLRVRLFPGISPAGWPAPATVAPGFVYLLNEAVTGRQLVFSLADNASNALTQ